MDFLFLFIYSVELVIGMLILPFYCLNKYLSNYMQQFRVSIRQQLSDYYLIRYQPPFRTVRARIVVALVVFIKTPINHIFFKSLIIPDYGFELTKTIYLNVFRNWNALCKSTRLYKSCSIPAGNKRKLGKAISQHSLWKKSSSFKMKRSIKIRRHGFVEEIYGITLAKFQAN